METDIVSAGAKNEFSQLATALIPKNEANIFNQAIMEFGALQCVPKSPDCGNCVFNDSCLALKKKKVTQLPVKSKKTKVTNRYFNYLVFSDEIGNTIIHKRIQKGIWQNLYEFPLLETVSDDDGATILILIQGQTFVENKIQEIQLYNPEIIRHKLSHQHLHIKFWKIKVEGTLSDGIDCKSATEFPFPIVIFNFIEKLWL